MIGARIAVRSILGGLALAATLAGCSSDAGPTPPDGGDAGLDGTGTGDATDGGGGGDGNPTGPTTP